jgi:low affinity Fe/Cu permease
MNCFNLIERVLIKKLKALELREGQKNLQAIQSLEKELIAQAKKEAKNKKVSIEEAKNSEIETEVLENLMTKVKSLEPIENNNESLSIFN